ncbi:hypothetical protein BU24DRAFT_374933 [Aaosphaeria arxii CBS 175.79]|uniref:DUF2418 domain-containing protein n=1 Tax=Aaosphaeria arxii CBS 175.79 TaxID=1450172 RepID=A0A6A5XJG9_9PLEO|nr:uncharacterized protein BU24DRAFT_374933 [Aaosphaeria arxii CBS 175.79]KAF2013016.1 hypothetical protein BU24DRAFT_374933 [Aaosphaeria arxii CBS 175.79]
MPRLVRRAPLSERIKAYLDPWDWLMWASEELNSSDWDEFAKDYATSIGVGMNLVFVVAKANTGGSNTSIEDDVFHDEARGAGWLKWFAGMLVFILATLSFLNGFYTFYRKRHYRLFEQPIEMNPATPSAQRVRVDSSPSTASPLRFLKNMVSAGSAESRAHPDAERDVWEIAVWDPNPLCLQLFCLFSPLHVVLYYSNLPVEKLDPRPSVRVVTTILVAAVLTVQLTFLQRAFKQQIKDSAIIHREVLHEYDTKFVHPAFQRPSRDVGIQTISKDHKSRDSSVGVRGSGELASEVVTYTPTTIIKRGFHTNPNQAYASQYDPDNLSSQPSFQPRLAQNTPSFRPSTSSNYVSTSTGTAGADFSSPIRPSHTPNPFRQPQFRQSQVGSGSGDGGSLGVFSHAASPLRKSASANHLRDDSRSRHSLGGAGERRAGSPTKREGSPLKRISTPAGFTGASGVDARSSGTNLADRFNKGYSGLGVGRRESGRF